jgi:hypothetical protein
LGIASWTEIRGGGLADGELGADRLGHGDVLVLAVFFLLGLAVREDDLQGVAAM